MAVPRQVHLFDRPTRFVAGTVGQPGDRTFYLQATDETGRTVSVALEKTQVQVLADRMSELLDEIAERAGTVIPPEADIDDLEPLTRRGAPPRSPHGRPTRTPPSRSPRRSTRSSAARPWAWPGTARRRPSSSRPWPPPTSRSTRTRSCPTATRAPTRCA